MEQEYGDAMICTIFVKFGVTHQMAPVSRLLVYYVKENGEGVADSVTFRVRPQYRNHVSSIHLGILDIYAPFSTEIYNCVRPILLYYKQEIVLRCHFYDYPIRQRTICTQPISTIEGYNNQEAIKICRLHPIWHLGISIKYRV